MPISTLSGNYIEKEKGEKFSINSKKVNTISNYVTAIPQMGISAFKKKYEEGQYYDADL